MDYQKLFLQRWKELEKEDGETSFLEKDIFFKFFTSPEILVVYYVWRESGNLECAYELFMDEYDDWVDDCNKIMFGRFFYDTINIIRRTFYYGKTKETGTSSTNDRRKTKHHPSAPGRV